MDRPLPSTREQARLERHQLFFTGEPCSQGHIAPRRVRTNQCTACSREKRLRSRQLAAERQRRDERLKEQARLASNDLASRRSKEADYKRRYRARRQRAALWFAEQADQHARRRLHRTARRLVHEHLQTTHLLRSNLSYRRIQLTGPALRVWLRAQFQPGMTWANYHPKDIGCWGVYFRRPPEPQQGLDGDPGPLWFRNLVPLWNEPPTAAPPAPLLFPPPAPPFADALVEIALLEQQQAARMQRRRQRRRTAGQRRGRWPPPGPSPAP